MSHSHLLVSDHHHGSGGNIGGHGSGESLKKNVSEGSLKQMKVNSGPELGTHPGHSLSPGNRISSAPLIENAVSDS